MLPYKWAAEENRSPEGWEEYACHVEVNMYNYDLIRYLEDNGWEKFNSKIYYSLGGGLPVPISGCFSGNGGEHGSLYYGLPFDKVVSKKK